MNDHRRVAPGCSCAAELQPLEELGKLRRKRLLHSHHRLHEPLVPGCTGKEAQELVPAEEIVVDAAANEPEHVPEHRLVRVDDVVRNAHEATELQVDLAVAAADV